MQEIWVTEQMTSTGVLYESQTARGVGMAGASDEEGQEGYDIDEGDDEGDDDIWMRMTVETMGWRHRSRS